MSTAPGQGESESPSTAAAAERIAVAYRNGSPFPVFTAEGGLADLSAAYEVQSGYVRRRLGVEPRGGFKIGVTDKPSQARIGVAEPLVGVLFGRGRRENGARLDVKAFRKAIVETEICFVLGAAITSPLPDKAALRAAVATVGPAIEFADNRFAADPPMRGLDLAAADVAASHYIVGTQLPTKRFDFATVTIRVARDGVEIKNLVQRGPEADPFVFGLWLVNRMIKRGWHLAPGDVLLTGLRGEIIEPMPGRYLADYGVLGRVEFTLV
jgi:2-keto-4-pentenoate hydratase